jgi:protein gp37
MNKQGSKQNPDGGIEWTHIFGPGTGYTANPVRGCQHKCKWRMPDGKVVICYAKAQRERMDGNGAFENITFHPEILDTIRAHKKPAGIFIDSMSDLFALKSESLWIAQTFDAMLDCPQHVFFSLTKNPTRLCDIPSFPPNLFLGVSMPPTFMFGKELTMAQQRVWFDKALSYLCDCDARVRWVSLEPLSWDCSDILAKFKDKLHWAVIGAASTGAQPDDETLNNVLSTLDGLPVFFKGNLKFSPVRREFPKIP